MNLGVFEFSNPICRNSNILRKSREARKKVGIFAGNMEMAAQWLKQGVDLVTINSELGLLAQYVKQSLGKLETLIREP
jgi:2-keto-3-deoxy-L-rhamnonate aldolase RhmA